jgi:hypothetical protein
VVTADLAEDKKDEDFAEDEEGFLEEVEIED